MAARSSRGLHPPVGAETAAVPIRREEGEKAKRLLADWPGERPRDWLKRMERTETKPDLDRLRHFVQPAQPYSGEARCRPEDRKRPASLSSLHSDRQGEGDPGLAP